MGNHSSITTVINDERQVPLAMLNRPDAWVDNSPPRRPVWDPAATDLGRVQRCVTLMLYITPVITSRSSTTHRSAEPTIAGTAAAPPVVESTHRQPSAGRCIRHAACERAWTPALCCC